MSHPAAVESILEMEIGRGFYAFFEVLEMRQTVCQCPS